MPMLHKQNSFISRQSEGGFDKGGYSYFIKDPTVYYLLQHSLPAPSSRENLESLNANSNSPSLTNIDIFGLAENACMFVRGHPGHSPNRRPSNWSAEVRGVQMRWRGDASCGVYVLSAVMAGGRYALYEFVVIGTTPPTPVVTLDEYTPRQTGQPTL